jgi:hypothetical protein
VSNVTAFRVQLCQLRVLGTGNNKWITIIKLPVLCHDQPIQLTLKINFVDTIMQLYSLTADFSVRLSGLLYGAVGCLRTHAVGFRRPVQHKFEWPNWYKRGTKPGIFLEVQVHSPLFENPGVRWVLKLKIFQILERLKYSSAVGIATQGWTVRGSKPGAGEISAPVPTGPGAHSAYYTVGTGSFPGVKRPGRSVQHPPTSSAEVEGRVEL